MFKWLRRTKLTGLLSELVDDLRIIYQVAPGRIVLLAGLLVTLAGACVLLAL